MLRIEMMKSIRLVALSSAVALLSLALIGCGLRHRTRVQVSKGVVVGPREMTVEEIDARLKVFADMHVSAVAEVWDEIEKSATDPQVRFAAHRAKLKNAMATYSIVSDPNPIVGVLDMLVLVQLQRTVVEARSLPPGFEDFVPKLLAVSSASLDEIWELADDFLTTQQQAELRQTILDWREANPDLQYVEQVRFTDFAAARAETIAPARERPGSVFRLFYLDPLSGMDPVAREVRFSRLFAERVFFYSQRLPLLLSWQLKDGFNELSTAPAMQRFSGNMERFAGSAEEITAVVRALPDQVGRRTEAALDRSAALLAKEREAMLQQADEIISTHREAAIDQMAEKVADERQQITAELENQQSSIRELLADTRETLGAVDTAAASLNTTTLSMDKFASRFQKKNDIPGEEEKKPFDINEYTHTATRISEAARELNTAVNSLDTLLASPHLAGSDSPLFKSISEAEQSGKRILRTAFLYLLVLVIALLSGAFLLALLYRRLSSKS